MDMMMALRAHTRGGPEQLVYEQAPVPVPQPGEALVTVHAAAITFAVLVVGASTPVRAQQNAPVSIGDTDIGGVVTGPKGPEAGVWVIAETADLPTKMVKIVVTDDQGRRLCTARITNLMIDAP